MKHNRNNRNGSFAPNLEWGGGTGLRDPFRIKVILNSVVLAVSLNIGTTIAGGVDIPSSLPASPLFGAGDFDQQMLRFEEFGVHPVPAPGTAAPKVFPTPRAVPPFGFSTCDGRPLAADMDAFLDAPLWPDPTMEANITLDNPWATFINPCLFAAGITGNIEGRPPGSHFAHQRWAEFPPQVYFQTAQGGSRTNNGARDDEQSHQYAVGEFAPGGLYNNTVGVGGFEGTTSGLGIKLHPNMPLQAPNSLWTFGDGTLPPKLLRARYGEPVLLRHYNVLPIDVSANNGFGEHTLTTHEHNGHNPGESDGFAGAFFYPGQFYDYRWPMQLAGYDLINRNASDPRASTPCSIGEVMKISDPITGLPVEKTCDPVTGTINIAGDWHEIMSTHWFHDHMIDRTSENVYKGNVAMMNYYSGIDRGHEGFRCEYDDPANNINLCFPSGTALDWGNRDYDVQLLISAKAWKGPSGDVNTNGQLDMAPLNEDGFLGDRMTVNWLYKPYMDVRARRYRFRILDGAVARFFKFALVREFNDATSGDFAGPANSNKSYSRVSYHMIANDGNIMEHAIPFPNAQSKDLPVQAIAERYDVIVDFSQFPVGTKLYMVNTLAHVNGKRPDGVVPLASILNETFNPEADFDCSFKCWSDDPSVGKFLEFRVQEYNGTDLSMNPVDYEIGKKKMISPVKFSDAELAAAKHRTFTFGRGGGTASDGRPTPWAIQTNGGASLNADLNRVSAAPETMGGGVEIWHIVNGGNSWAHPVHIHFEEGQIILRSDIDVGGNITNKHLPPMWEMGARKDMYRVSGLGGPLGIPDSSSVIDVAIRFREFAGTFVEHCHNTTHEDKAMLLRWDNEHPGQTIRIPTPVPSWDGVGYVGEAGQTWTRQDGTIASGVDTLAAAKISDPAQASFISPTQLTGDLNKDGIVNLTDFVIFRSQYGLPGLWAGDLDENILVNLTDFVLFRQGYGMSAGFPLPPNDPFP